MKLFNNDLGNELPRRYTENSDVDFYVLDEVCIACGAPEAEATGLIEHSKSKYGHCYFKKQPQTPFELDSAIRAMEVSCIDAIRYGGTDEVILKRLYEKGLKHLCDHKPLGKYKMIIRNKVDLQYEGTLLEFSAYLISHLTASLYLDHEIVDFSTNNLDYCQFTHRWIEGLKGIIFKCRRDRHGLIHLRMKKEKNTSWFAIMGVASSLNLAFSLNNKVRDVLWYDLDGNKYSQTQVDG